MFFFRTKVTHLNVEVVAIRLQIYGGKKEHKPRKTKSWANWRIPTMTMKNEEPSEVSAEVQVLLDKLSLQDREIARLAVEYGACKQHLTEAIQKLLRLEEYLGKENYTEIMKVLDNTPTLESQLPK
jgi:hypothetical protein